MCKKLIITSKKKDGDILGGKNVNAKSILRNDKFFKTRTLLEKNQLSKKNFFLVFCLFYTTKNFDKKLGIKQIKKVK